MELQLQLKLELKLRAQLGIESRVISFLPGSPIGGSTKVPLDLNDDDDLRVLCSKK